MNSVLWIGRLMLLYSLFRTVNLFYHEIIGKISIQSSRYGSAKTWTRLENPEKFRDVMAVEWLNSIPFLLCGFLVLAICRWASRMDPFAPGFGEGAFEKDNSTEANPQKPGL